jgi:hypothetical protein
VRDNNHLEVLVKELSEQSPFFKNSSSLTTQTWLLQHVPKSLLDIRSLQDMPAESDEVTVEIRVLCNFLVKQLSNISPLIASKILGHNSREENNAWIARHLPETLLYYARLRSLRFLIESLIPSDTSEVNGKSVLKTIGKSLTSSSAEFAHTSLFTVTRNNEANGFIITVPIFDGMQEDLVAYQVMAARLIGYEKNRISSDLGANVKIQIARIKSSAFKTLAENIAKADFDPKGLVIAAQGLGDSAIKKSINFESAPPLTEQEYVWLNKSLQSPGALPSSIARMSSKYKQFGTRLEAISLEYLTSIQKELDTMRHHLPTEKSELFAFLAATPDAIVREIYNRDMLLVSLFEDFGVPIDRQMLVKSKTTDLLIQLAELSEKEKKPFTPIVYEHVDYTVSMQNTEIH